MPTLTRVLQVFAQMNRGGAETMIMNLYRNMDRSKVQFDFVVHTSEECNYDDEIKKLGGKIYRIPRYTGKNHFEYKRAWNEFFKAHSEYKIIHGHVRSTASIYLKIAKKFGLTTIAHSHSTSSGRGVSALVKNIMQFPIKNTADYLFACSRKAGKWLFGDKACNRNNFFVLKNAIDVKKFIYNEEVRLQKRKEFNLENKFVIGHIGRFNTPKNHGFLIDIFKSVHDKNSDAALVLVGDGELRLMIENKVEILGLSNSVIFTGVRSDINELLQAMDVFIFPSLYEGLPVTLIEAQASGIPCIMSSNVTKEVEITAGLIENISLTKSADYWAESLLKFSMGYKRENTYNLIVDKGYDITTVTTWYQKFCLDKV